MGGHREVRQSLGQTAGVEVGRGNCVIDLLIQLPYLLSELFVVARFHWLEACVSFVGNRRVSCSLRCESRCQWTRKSTILICGSGGCGLLWVNVK